MLASLYNVNKIRQQKDLVFVSFYNFKGYWRIKHLKIFLLRKPYLFQNLSSVIFVNGQAENFLMTIGTKKLFVRNVNQM